MGSSGRERFEAARVARLATIRRDGSPRVMPITFAVVADEILTAVDHKPKRTPRLKRLEDIAADPRVSVVADHYDDDWAELWWVRADGVATILEPGSTRHLEAATALAAKYADYRRVPIEGPVIAIGVRRWSSWSAAAGGRPAEDR